MSDLKRKRGGELRRVRCRVCREVLNYQSYPKHLESHPGEDPSDRREAGQGKLFGGVMVKKVVQEEQKEQDEYDEDIAVTMGETVDIVEVKNKEELIVVEDENNNKGEKERSVVETKEIKNVILKFLESEGARVSFEDCTTEEEKLNKCLLLVGKRLKVK